MYRYADVKSAASRSPFFFPVPKLKVELVLVMSDADSKFASSSHAALKSIYA